MKLSNLRNIKPKKTWIILGVALGIGLLAALVASSYLSSQMAAIEARSKGVTVDVIVAKRDLVKGAALTSESVAVRPVPVEFAHSAAIVPAEFDRIDGQILAYPIKSGDAILWGLMEGKKVPTFSARVEVGHRAMTVPVDEINSISGLLEPGDVIDLMVTVDKSGKKSTFPLMQSAAVMATGQRSVDDPKSGERRQYSTVTLDTTPEQAHYVIVAREIGKITALLRNPQDKTAMPDGGADIASLLGIRAGSIAGDAMPAIPVLYGGAAGLSAEALVLKKYANSAPPQTQAARLSGASEGGGLTPAMADGGTQASNRLAVQ